MTSRSVARSAIRRASDNEHSRAELDQGVGDRETRDAETEHGDPEAMSSRRASWSVRRAGREGGEQSAT